MLRLVSQRARSLADGSKADVRGGVAGQVTRTAATAPPIGSAPSQLSRKCDACKAREEAQTLQTKRAGAAEPASKGAPGIVHEVLRSGGEPLSEGVRSVMEPRFGHDFDHVRVHTNSRAAQSALAVNALAYTVGRDVVFGAGQYAPTTGRGQRLLAHELAHVIQQRSATPHPESVRIADTAAPHEREADVVVDRVLRGETPLALHATPVALHRSVVEEEPCPPQPLGDPRRGRERPPSPEGGGVRPGAGPKCVGRPAKENWCKSDKAGCDPTDHEGFPLIQQGDVRNAVGYAQCILNRMLLEMRLCQIVPSCLSGYSTRAVNSIRTHLSLISKLFIDVDCNFGPDTDHATRALQAYWFKDPNWWDGQIGKETWAGLKQK
jgi:hypothetical protein